MGTQESAAQAASDQSSPLPAPGHRPPVRRRLLASEAGSAEQALPLPTPPQIQQSNDQQPYGLQQQQQQAGTRGSAAAVPTSPAAGADPCWANGWFVLPQPTPPPASPRKQRKRKAAAKPSLAPYLAPSRPDG